MRSSLTRALFALTVLLTATDCAVRHDMAPAHMSAPPAPAVRAPDLVDSPYRRLDGLPEGTILHVPTGVELTHEQLIDVLAAARIVYVGESHDNIRHHRIQLDILQALADRLPGKVAVGMEMFQRPSQPELNRWSRGEVDEKAFLTTWYENWTEDYDYYRDILTFIRDRHIPLLALNASERTARSLAEGGREALSAEERASIPDIDTTDPFHRRQMEAVFGAHAKGAGFDAFYRTMLLWDETMAQTAAEFLTGPAGRDKALVVFAGGGHVAYGFGIPRRVFRRAPLPYVTVLPHTEVGQAPPDRPDVVMDVEPVTLPLPVADIVWAVGYEDLEGSKVHLGVRVEPAEGGVLINDVAADSAAARAGLREGDLIVSFDGEPVRKPVDLVRRVRTRHPGDRASLTITRESQALTVDVSWPP
ncbi:MAG: ChaN family lipoprotein [Nitrospirae bacterium]|nr:ChaN family lipoprotein [Nitrospirota bacterium]